MSKKLLGILALVCAFAINTTVFAQEKCGEGMSQMIESLNLDDSQKQKIKPILEDLKTNIKQSADQMRDLSKQINEQAASSTMDQTAVNDLIDKKTKLIGDMIKAKVTAKNQIYAILKPEQKTQLQSKMKQTEEKWAEKFKNCHDRDE
jgi:protein CpxP